MPIDVRFAFIISSPTVCTLNNAPVADLYQAGDAYADSGAGWASLFSTDGRYDVPSFVTLIQPAMDVARVRSGATGFRLPGSCLGYGLDTKAVVR